MTCGNMIFGSDPFLIREILHETEHQTQDEEEEEEEVCEPRKHFYFLPFTDCFLILSPTGALGRGGRMKREDRRCTENRKSHLSERSTSNHLQHLEVVSVEPHVLQRGGERFHCGHTHTQLVV